MPTYLLSDSSDLRPAFSASLGGGGLLLLPFPPRASPPPPLFPYLPPELPPRPLHNLAPFPWFCPYDFMGPCPPLLSQCPLWDPRSPPPSNFRFCDGSMTSLATLMYPITESLLCPRIGACERVQDLMQSPLERNRRQISLPSAAKGMRIFSKSTAPVISPSLSMIRSCRSTPWLNTVSIPPPPPLGLAPIPCPSDLRRPSSFCAGVSTYIGVEFNHSPLSTFF